MAYNVFTEYLEHRVFHMYRDYMLVRCPK